LTDRSLHNDFNRLLGRLRIQRAISDAAGAFDAGQKSFVN
jgi:hypothetical protein